MFEKVQPIEDKLRIYGTVKGKTKKMPVDNVSLKAILSKRKDGILDGDLMTDSLGRYVFDLPDIDGEWNLQIASKLDDKMKDYRICIDRNFTPKARFMSPLEAEMIKADDTHNLKWQKPVDDEESIKLLRQSRILKNVDVKAKGRVWDRSGWSHEDEARYMSKIYYDSDADMDAIEDAGEYAPSLVEWLKKKNSFFYGEEQPSDVLLYVCRPLKGVALKDPILSFRLDTVMALSDWIKNDSPAYTENEMMPKAPNRKFYRDGLRYKVRPIVWIVDNMYVTITGFKMKGKAMTMNIIYCDNGANAIDIPLSLDEVKSIYISEDPRSMLPHIKCDVIEQMNPVILYCYTHRTGKEKQKGVRYTHFEGYNVPSTFEMEDYSVVPPMEDFRRTLYWNPNVKTDKEGNATVEFYNNSSCTEISVSAEGMTEDGKYVYY